MVLIGNATLMCLCILRLSTRTKVAIKFVSFLRRWESTYILEPGEDWAGGNIDMGKNGWDNWEKNCCDIDIYLIGRFVV